MESFYFILLENYLIRNRVKFLILISFLLDYYFIFNFATHGLD
jgi:hypothetical protein